ncbi:hypothetical protein BH11MYX1_BH11MYX1_49700 [soil metagenome]
MLLALGACGRFGFREYPELGDGGHHGDLDSDSIDAPSTCIGTGTFTNLQKLANVNSAAYDNGAELSRDGLSLYFNSGSAIVVSTRPTLADPFSPPAPITELMAGGDASDPSVTSDGLEIFFDSFRTNQICLFRSTRTSLNAAFDAPMELLATCSATTASGAAISGDGLTLVYNSTLDSLGEGELYLSHRTSRTDDFPPGTKLASLPGASGYAWLSADQLRLYFEHTVGGVIGLYSARRISPSDDFTNVQPIAELDDGGNSFNVDISMDPTESVVFFATSRSGMGDDIWSAERPCL